MKGRRLVKEGLLSLETIETWIVYVCHSEGEWARQNDLSAFEWCMVVGPWCTGLWEELQFCWVFHAQQFPVCIKNGPPPVRHLTTLRSIGVNMGQHPCGMLSTPCGVHARQIEAVLRAKGGATPILGRFYKCFVHSVYSIHTNIQHIVYYIY